MSETAEPPLQTLTGGCRCRRVRYEARTPGLRSVVCACSDCQRSSGSFVSVAVGIRADRFQILAGADVIKSYADTGESGQPVRRHFCGECGSPLFGRLESAPELVSLRAVSLDEPFDGKPAFAIFTGNIPRWIELVGVPSADDADLLR